MQCRSISALILAPLLFAALGSTQQATKTYTPPKTPWGDPDLQGIWPGNMGVPMQRPKTMGERTELTDEEYSRRVDQSQKASAADAVEFAPADQRIGIGPPSYWTERGKPTRQASLVIDPPDGRL